MPLDCTGEARLEKQFGCHLDLALVIARPGAAETSVHGVAGSDVCRRPDHIEVGMVENVEEFRPKLEGEAFAQSCIFVDADTEIPKARGAEGVSRGHI